MIVLGSRIIYSCQHCCVNFHTTKGDAQGAVDDAVDALKDIVEHKRILSCSVVSCETLEHARRRIGH